MSQTEKVFIAIPAHNNKVNLSLLQMAFELPIVTAQPGNRFEFFLWADGGVRPQEYCRNRLIKRFLDSGADTLLMIDNDMIQMGWKTLKLLDTPGYDIAAPVQMMFHPINYEEGRDVPELYACSFVWDKTQEHKLHPTYPVSGDKLVQDVEAVGSGCMAIKRHVLEDKRMLLAPGMNPPAFFRNVYEANGNRLRGLDIDFCKRAHDLGYKIKMNWEAEIGHLKEVDLNQVNIFGLSQYKLGKEAAKHEVQMDQAQGGSKAGNGGMDGPTGVHDETVAQFRLDRAPGPSEGDAAPTGGSEAQAQAGNRATP